jgi:hypothetical protein
MLVPSNDVRSKSDELPGTATAFVDCQPLGGWQLCAAAAGVARSQRIGALNDEQVAPPATMMARAPATTSLVAELTDRGRGTLRSGGADPVVPITGSPPHRGFFGARSEWVGGISRLRDPRHCDHDPCDPPAFTIERQMIVQRSLAQEPARHCPRFCLHFVPQSDLALAPYNDLLLPHVVRLQL